MAKINQNLEKQIAEFKMNEAKTELIFAMEALYNAVAALTEEV